MGKKTFEYNNINYKKIFSTKISKFFSYAQNFEDFILFCIFYNKKNGFYIDVGANDPNLISITKAFYLRGWNGINIEPLPDKYNEFVKYRKRDINLQICVGEKEGTSTFYVSEGNTSLIKEKSKKKKYIKVKIDTMKNICRKYVPNLIEIQFCKIHIKTNEKKILLGFDFENYRPKVFCIESFNIKGKLFYPSYLLWEDILIRNDYFFIYQQKNNRFYIDNRVKGLREKFMLVNTYIKLYNK